MSIDRQVSYLRFYYSRRYFHDDIIPLFFQTLFCISNYHTVSVLLPTHVHNDAIYAAPCLRSASENWLSIYRRPVFVFVWFVYYGYWLPLTGVAIVLCHLIRLEIWFQVTIWYSGDVYVCIRALMHLPTHARTSEIIRCVCVCVCVCLYVCII